MRNAALMLAAAGLAAGAAALSRGTGPAGTPPPVRVAVEGRNPWTGLPDGGGGRFHFAVVSDRTGGHRAGVFSRAVERLNLLRPAFVVSVGDLIEGGPDAAANRKQWAELNGYVNRLTMPFFYAPGNHDRASAAKNASWAEHFGRSYYSFAYKGVLFVVLDAYDHADEPAGTPLAAGRFGPRQIEAVRAALAAHADARWTFVLLHPPVWAMQPPTPGFDEIETLLAGRNYTVFAGHKHEYRKFVRRGQSYYQLATTGGASAMRGLEYGEFDQVAWVTVPPGGPPTVANVLLDSVLTESLAVPATAEGGREGKPDTRRYHEVRGVVYLDGTPLAGAEVGFGGTGAGGNARTAADGSFRVYTGRGRPGLPAGKYVVTVRPAQPLVSDGRPPAVRVPARYAYAKSSPLAAEVTGAGPNDYRFGLTSAE